MSNFASLLASLLRSGQVHLNRRPETAAPDDSQVRRLLAETFDAFALQVAGPPLSLHFETARAAGALVLQACWFLVSDSEPESELQRCLVMPYAPQTPEQHLSADLLFRFLPQIHQRARAIDRGDKLALLLAELLRRWPLSGVLSGVEDAPLTAPDFAHAGLQMLYAERLARNEKPAWLPQGRGLEYVEMVWKELGKDATVLMQAGQATSLESRNDQ
jgi:MoxR-vWA-beta-propeller ternary system domain bpX4